MPTYSSKWVGVVCAVGLLVMGTAAGQQPEWQGFEEALTVADSTGRFVMVAVHAPWCGWCHKMESDVYSSAGVRRCVSESFVATRLNRDDTDTRYRYRGRRRTPRALAAAFQADGVPATVLLSPEGEYLLHLSGFVEAEALRVLLAYMSTHAHRDQSYDAFRADPAGCRSQSAGPR
ncbi:thioredoxin family protein [Salinibacter altiplanensis]|uniref:thioredoxin family protein n=1 Tax=Salinibacter altiplanensis TaxID=1803181 RepID=UPI000C9FA2D7|nr:thioredoxin family protein [Salinibacter altiplanensis]